jgi:hypothetical protein
LGREQQREKDVRAGRLIDVDPLKEHAIGRAGEIKRAAAGGADVGVPRDDERSMIGMAGDVRLDVDVVRGEEDARPNLQADTWKYFKGRTRVQLAREPAEKKRDKEDRPAPAPSHSDPLSAARLWEEEGSSVRLNRPRIWPTVRVVARSRVW